MALAPSRREARIDPADEWGDAEEASREVFDLYPNGKPCFYCAGVLRDAADEQSVYWAGPGRCELVTIHLHPACAVRLGEQLIGDGLNAKHAAKARGAKAAPSAEAEPTRRRPRP